jgi:hypothetical protein
MLCAGKGQPRTCGSCGSRSGSLVALCEVENAAAANLACPVSIVGRKPRRAKPAGNWEQAPRRRRLVPRYPSSRLAT